MINFEILRTMSVGITLELSTNRFYLQLICDHEDEGIERSDHFILISPEVAAEIVQKCFVEIDYVNILD